MSEAMALDEQEDIMGEQDIDMADHLPEVEIPQTIERNQQSINAFFGGRAPSLEENHPATHDPERQQTGFWMDAGR